MTSPSCGRMDPRSPHPARRGVRRRPEYGEEPAITVLPPDPKMTSEFFRSSSPGVYKAAPTKAANSKGVSSFVILGEMLNTPVQSRPASPSGRVSPFRGHGFKSPAASRATSRAPSPTPTKPVVPKKPPRPRYKTDIGLPPKSPKKIKPRPVKNANVQRTNLGVENKAKGNKTPRPMRKPLTVADGKKNGGKPKKEAEQEEERPEGMTTTTKTTTADGEEEAEEMVLVETPKETNMEEVSEALSNLVSEIAREAKADGEEVANLGGDAGEAEETKKENIVEVKPKEETPATAAESHKREAEVAQAASSGADQKAASASEKAEKAEKAEKVEPERKETEKLIPCFQPDKCHIAPPTMASPSPIIASAINAPSITSGPALTKTTESIETAQASTVTTTSLNALSSAVTISGNLARKSQLNRDATRAAPAATLAVPTQVPAKKEEERNRSTPKEEEPKKPDHQVLEVDEMPPHSQLSGTIVGKKNPPDPGQDGVLSTTNLIKVDSDLELLSANNLKDSPPRRQLNPAWSEERLVNGDVPSPAPPQSKLRRFFSRLFRIIQYILCCRCIVDRCRRSTCCANRPKCCRRSGGDGTPSSPTSCCSPCCPRLTRCGSCCKCRKPKCCEGSVCRKSTRPAKPKRKCCAKPNCSCKDCCSGMRNCCSGLGSRIRSLCRSVFCLNTICCQSCLRKSCRSCHRMKCCQAGGLCSCFNPNVKKPPRLDKRASTQSKTDNENLDPVLVEHVSLMKAAIPVLPTCLAILCLVLNLVFPGSGTLLSGVFCLCFGKPRFSVKDSAKNRVGSFFVNLVIGIAQLFTIIFCLVGWGWSIWWGVIMYRLARKQRRIKLAEKSTQEAKNSANQNHVDVEKG